MEFCENSHSMLSRSGFPGKKTEMEQINPAVDGYNGKVALPHTAKRFSPMQSIFGLASRRTMLELNGDVVAATVG